MIKVDTNKLKDIPLSWIIRLNTVKMSTLFNTIYRINTIPIKVLEAFLQKQEKQP